MFFVKTANWRPSRFFQGRGFAWDSFSLPSATSFLLSFGASFVAFDVMGFSLNWLFTLIAVDKKENFSPNADWIETVWPGKNKLHHYKERV